MKAIPVPAITLRTAAVWGTTVLAVDSLEPGRSFRIGGEGAVSELLNEVRVPLRQGDEIVFRFVGNRSLFAVVFVCAFKTDINYPLDLII